MKKKKRERERERQNAQDVKDRREGGVERLRGRVLHDYSHQWCP